MQEAGASSQPAPGPSQGPSPVKRSFSDSIGSRQSGPSPVKRPFVPSSEAHKKEMERLLKKEAFLENQLLHLLQALHKRYDDERQSIAEEQRRLANRLIEINDNQRNEEQTIREKHILKLSDVRRDLTELQNMTHGGLMPTSTQQGNEPITLHALRGLREDVANEVLQNSTAGREDVGSAAHFEHDLSTSQQSEVAQSSPEAHHQPNEESDGEISSSSDILILQAAGLLAEIGEAGHTGKLESGLQPTVSRDTKDEDTAAIADSSGVDQKEDSQEGKDKEKELAIQKLKTIGTVFEEELQCSICNELLVAAVTINCSHSFCKHCLGQWKKQRAECPMCRVAITAENRSVMLDSLIDTLVGQLSVELQQRHKEVQEERAAIDAAAALASAASTPGTSGTTGTGGGGRQSGLNGRGPRGNHHNNYNWQPHPHPHPHQHQHQHQHPQPLPHHGYGHPHPPHGQYPPHAHAHPPHAHPPHAHPPHAHPPLAHPPPPHAHVPPPPHALPPPAHTHAPHAHAQPVRPPPPGLSDSPDHHLRVRRRHGRNILSSGSSSGSSSEEPSDSQSSYTSNFSNSSENSWFDGQYMSAEYEEDDGDYNVVPGIPGRYYGGYGVCFYCNQRGHWSNGCPVRFGAF